MNRLSLDEFHDAQKFPIHIVLDNIRSAHNVGSIFRTSDAFICEQIILGGITPTPPHPDLEKTALGATESMKWRHIESIAGYIDIVPEATKKVGIEITENSITLEEFNWPDGPVALIVGHEVNGVSNEVLKSCDEVIHIPQYGTKHSLNVAVSLSMVIWDYFTKKRRTK